jgi:hypothetical protein
MEQIVEETANKCADVVKEGAEQIFEEAAKQTEQVVAEAAEKLEKEIKGCWCLWKSGK